MRKKMNKEEHYLKLELYDQIKRDNTLFEFLQLGSLDGIWYWDLETQNDEWMSPRFWTLLGYDPAKMKHLASEWQDLIFPEDLEIALDNFKKHCADQNHAYDQIVRYRHRDGSTVWVRCRGIVIRDKIGKPIRMLGAHTDLTDLKRTEEELKERTIQLESANKRLNTALAEIKQLSAMLPICCVCKKIRDDEGYWHQVEAYIREQTGTDFSHGYCPECAEKLTAEIDTTTTDKQT